MLRLQGRCRTKEKKFVIFFGDFDSNEIEQESLATGSIIKELALF
jgi:hypothetical protein